MIDPLLSLAFSIYSNKGVYALLLGSGSSRSAGIPTGWEIVLELIRRLSHLVKENCEPDPAGWYRAKYGEEPDYAKLLDALVRSSAERGQMLRSYLEPTPEEREQGLKVPTAAHKAIAQLIAKGFIRIVVTTNFDRLIESALGEIGIVPSVISTPDAVKGALPLAHATCTIIKVHGDYLDTRIKNTPEELAYYSRPMNRLLDQVFEEYGLIVCGWSAEWDRALRSAIERSPSRRFAAFWATRDEPRDEAKRLIALRRAEVVRIAGADGFFQDLVEKVLSLEDIAASTLSGKVAVATLKRYLLDDRQRIRLRDLMNQEMAKVYHNLSHLAAPVALSHDLAPWMKRVEAIVELSRDLIIAGCYWGGPEHASLWTGCIERIADSRLGTSNAADSVHMYYPALVMLYAGGIAALAGERYNNFAALLTKTRVSFRKRDSPAVLLLNVRFVSEGMPMKSLANRPGHGAGLSGHLNELLRSPFHEYLPNDDQYRHAFDRFEYLLALVFADIQERSRQPISDPVGRFQRQDRQETERKVIEDMDTEITEAGEAWPPLGAGLFAGSLDRLLMIKREFDDHVI